jgi:hypothetical protein
VSKGAVMGSGSLSKGRRYEPGVYVGSKAGEAVCLKQAGPGEIEEEVKPSAYALAFMTPNEREALRERRKLPYFVLPEWFHILWCFFWTAVGAVVQRTPVAIAITFANAMASPTGFQKCNEDCIDGQNCICTNAVTTEVAILWCLLGLFVGYTATLIMVLTVDLGSKKILIGTREVGEFSWDTNSYCQRWQLYLSLVPIRHFMAGGRDILECFLGSPFLVMYYRILGAKIGRNVCLYPNGADPMMTEPEMVTIEDNVCIDSAMLIAHLNTKGKFTLGPLKIEKNSVMRTWARLQQGGTMARRSMLLEHTLILPGDQVPAKNLMQGWPAGGAAAKTMRGRRTAVSVAGSSAEQMHSVPALPTRPLLSGD